MSADAPDIGWPRGTDLIELAETTSTMDAAAERAIDRPAWITARVQTAGRGRAGKAWHTPKGNLQATWVAPADRPPMDLPLYSFVAALALRDTLANWVARDRLALKWPNDVLIDGAKVAGILLEARGGRAPRISIGVGVNIETAPPRDALPEGALPAIAMAEAADPDAALPLTSDCVLAMLARDFEHWRGAWSRQGFGALRRVWLNGAANLGATIRVTCAQETLVGTFETVDETGQLVLQTADGPRRIMAGDVFFGDA